MFKIIRAEMCVWLVYGENTSRKNKITEVKVSHSDLFLVCLSYYFKLLIVYTIIMLSCPIVLY